MDLANVLLEAVAGEVKKNDEPRIFTEAAYELRKLDLMEAKGRGEKEFRRLKLAVDWKVLHAVFKGREENPVDTAEYLAHRDAELAKLPAEAGDPQFTHEAYRVVSKINWDIKDELHKSFSGRFNVGEDEVWMEAAKIRVTKDTRDNVGIDATHPLICNNGKCAVRFVPPLWDFTITVKDKDGGGPKRVTITTGHYIPKDGVVFVFCKVCRENAIQEARRQGFKLHFFCEEEAEARAKHQKDAIAYEQRQAKFQERREERREERRSGVSNFVSDMFKMKLPRGVVAKDGRGNGNR